MSRQVYKLATLLVLLLFVNCQKEEITNKFQSEIQNQTATTRTVTGSDIPDVINFIQSKSNDRLEFDFEQNITNVRANADDPHENDIVITQAMSDEIIQVLKDGKSNYAFKTKEKYLNYFLNIIVVQTIDGYYMYFAKYVPSLEVIWDGNSLNDFEGTMYVYSDAGTYKSKSYYSGGQRSVYPCDCPYDDDGDDPDCSYEVWVRCGFRGSLHASQFECGCWVSQDPNDQCSGFTDELVLVCGGNGGNIFSVESSNINRTDICYCDDGNTGGIGGGIGGGSNNNCTNAAPCENELEEYNDDCQCELFINPIIPINPSPNMAKDINICLGTDFDVNALNANPTVDELYDYLFDDFGDCIPENANFSEKAAKALLEDGEVDVEEKRINGIKLDSNLPPCLESIILDLMLGNFPYTESIVDISLIEDVFNTLGIGNPLGIEIEYTYKTANIAGSGETSPLVWDSASNRWNCTITISEDLVNNGTKLALIKTVLHESIHGYLKYMRKEYPLVFNNPNGSFSDLIAAYQVHTDNNYAQHVYMANLIEDIATNIGNYVSENYGYPSPSSSGTALSHYEAVSWSGIALISDPISTLPYIENPVFVSVYPDANDRLNIRKIFDTENGTASYSGYSPLINNNCN